MEGDQTQDALDEGSLARAVLPEQADDFALGQLQIHMVQRLFSDVVLGDLLELDHAFHLQSFCHWSGVRQASGVASR